MALLRGRLLAGALFAGALYTTAQVVEPPVVVVVAGGGEIKPRKPTKPRPLWMPSVIWAIPLDDDEKPITQISPDAIVGDAALLLRKRRKKEEAELLLLRSLA